jgi:hypothetical protein
MDVNKTIIVKDSAGNKSVSDVITGAISERIKTI